MEPLQICDIAGLTPEQLAALTAIYREAFEAPWEMPVDQLPEFARRHTRDSLKGRALAVLAGDAALGLALTAYLPESNFLDLKYLAVAAARRNLGLGSRLLQAVAATGEEIALARGRAGCRGTLLEVEIPDSPPLDADRALRRRRSAFYARQGAIATGVPFARPAQAPPEQPDWELMVLPGRAWTGVLDGPLRRELGRALMVEGYAADPHAPWLRKYLDEIARPN